MLLTAGRRDVPAPWLGELGGLVPQRCRLAAELLAVLEGRGRRLRPCEGVGVSAGSVVKEVGTGGNTMLGCARIGVELFRKAPELLGMAGKRMPADAVKAGTAPPTG